MELIKELNKLEFHDSELLSLKFDFNSDSIEMTIKESFDKPSVIIIFNNIMKLNFEGLNELDIEIYSAQFSNHGEDVYSGKFTFLLGFGKPSSSLSFLFKNGSISKVHS